MKFGSKQTMRNTGPSASLAQKKISSRSPSGQFINKTSISPQTQSKVLANAAIKSLRVKQHVMLCKSMEKSFLRLRKPEARAAYVEAELAHGLAAQIRVLRNSKNWSQADLAVKLGTSQNAVCRLENPQYGRYSLKTLLALSKVFDVGLITRFVPFSKLMAVTWDTTSEALNVESYDEEAPRVVFFHPETSSKYLTDIKWASESLPPAVPKIAVTTTVNSSTHYLSNLNLITDVQNG